MADTDDRLWRIGDVAAYLGLTINSVYKLTAPKARLRIPHLRVSGRIRFRRADVDAWLDLQATSGAHDLRRIRQQARRGQDGNDTQAADG
jgi:excisionase family DNA binding protein